MNRIARRVYENILVKCIGAPDGCTWHGKISELSQHRECDCKKCHVVVEEKTAGRATLNEKKMKTKNKNKKKNRNKTNKTNKKSNKKANKRVNKKDLVVGCCCRRALM